MTDFDEKKHLTVKEAALVYRVSESTIRRWIKAGKTKYTKDGKMYFIERLPEPKLPEPLERDYYTTFEIADIYGYGPRLWKDRYTVARCRLKKSAASGVLRSHTLLNCIIK